MSGLVLAGRAIGPSHPPLVIAEIGINHEGSYEKAVRMVDDAKSAGCECVKFQCHVVEDEMVPAAGAVIPANAKESIWEIMVRCALSHDEEIRLKAYVEGKGMIYLSTPFSRAAADRLQAMGVPGFKIGSGECNHEPLLRHVAGFGKPVLLSTGMNDMTSIGRSVAILREAGVPFALFHCTSMYPTPYEKIRLGALAELMAAFPGVPIGLSDHSLGNYACFGATALGASLLERHFTSDKSWPGPDIMISMDPAELADLVKGSRALAAARGGAKGILPEEQPTIVFAYASVVTTRAVAAGEALSEENVWCKRPGTGKIPAREYPRVLGKKARRAIAANELLSPGDIENF